MSNPNRIPGLRGKLPAKRLPMKFLHEYAIAPLPAPAYPIDVTGGIGPEAYGMLGNGPDPTCTTHPDGVGDCTFAGKQHLRMVKAAHYGQTETWETSNALVAEYLKYDHGRDEGAVIADLLLYWYRHGTIKAFAPVDHTRPAAVDAAMQAFRGVYCGVSLTDNADQLFSEGKPWRVSRNVQPDPAEGHCIVKVTADGKGHDGYITWGALQKATATWTRACLDEAWVLVTTEDEAAKIDMPALLSDINALHGTGAGV